MNSTPILSFKKTLSRYEGNIQKLPEREENGTKEEKFWRSKGRESTVSYVRSVVFYLLGLVLRC